MSKISFLILCTPIVLFNSCVIGEKEGTVSYYYKVTGNSTNVSIIASSGFINETVTSLPWQTEEKTTHVDDETTCICTLRAVNNTSDDSTLTVDIYIDGKLKATDTATGSHCVAFTSYTVTDENL